jgi:TonB-linked SusC/RagA family outer membrane protein
MTQKLLERMQYLLLLYFLLFYTGTSLAQGISVKGKVTDETGQALPGVTILLKGSSTGATTNPDGNYTLNLPSSTGTLVVSFIGYTSQEIPINNRTTIHVNLVPDAKALGEVVVVAYGQQKKATVTGSIATIQTKELVQSPVSNLTNALGGRLPGLITTQRSGEPGVDGATFYIRGVHSLNNTSPIIMVDGVERSMDYLDPNDIESISILKDAAATAVLGMRGANGAVLVTTKRGKIGKPSINFRSSMGLQQATRLPDYLGSYDYARLRNEALANDGGQPVFTDEQLEGYRNGSLPNTDFYKFLMKPSRVAAANLNISGGAEQARYFISAGYNRSEGNYRHTRDNAEGFDTNNIMDRFNLRANVDVDITKNMSVRLDLAGILTARRDGNNSAGSIMNLANRMAPIYPIFNENGSLYGNGTFTQNIYGEVARKGYRMWYNNTVQGTFAVTRKLDFITKNLKANVSFSYDNTNTPHAEYGKDYAVFQPEYNALGEVATYRQFGNNTQINPNGSFNGGDARRNTYMEASLSWNESYGKSDVTAMALANRRLLLNNSEIPYAYESVLFRGTYTYNTKYIAELSASYQGSENFPSHSRYGLFPSVSAGWIISEEPFLKNQLAFLDFLKIRGSYGEVGNDRSGNDRFLWFTSWGTGRREDYGYAFGEGWRQGAVGNDNVTWERGRQANVALEANLWKGKLGVTAEVFKERRSNILLSRTTLTDVFGQNIKPQNIGIVDNHGFEVELTHNNRIGRVNYFVKPNMTFARNNIVYQDEVLRKYPWMSRTGHPVGTKFGLISDGFFGDADDIANSPGQNFSNYGPGDMKYVKLTPDDEYDYIQESFDETAIGYSRTPEIMYGATMGADYRGFDLSLLLQGAAHADVILDNEAVYEFFQEGKVKPFHLNRWTPETAATATYPRLHYSTNGNNHRASDFWVKSADYLRIKNAEIGYTLPKNLISVAGFSYFRVYANGMNLHTWDKLKEYQVDPETGDGNGAMYPIQKIWNFGVDVRF